MTVGNVSHFVGSIIFLVAQAHQWTSPWFYVYSAKLRHLFCAERQESSPDTRHPPIEKFLLGLGFVACPIALKQINRQKAQNRRWPFGKIDGPGRWKPPPKPVPSMFNQTKKDTYAQNPWGSPHKGHTAGHLTAPVTRICFAAARGSSAQKTAAMAPEKWTPGPAPLFFGVWPPKERKERLQSWHVPRRNQ